MQEPDAAEHLMSSQLHPSPLIARGSRPCWQLVTLRSWAGLVGLLPACRATGEASALLEPSFPLRVLIWGLPAARLPAERPVPLPLPYPVPQRTRNNQWLEDKRLVSADPSRTPSGS